jgi:hypothetical protein
MPLRILRRGTAIVMYFLIALSYVVNAMDRSVFSDLVKSITTEFHLSLAEGGLLSTVVRRHPPATAVVAIGGHCRDPGRSRSDYRTWPLAAIANRRSVRTLPSRGRRRPPFRSGHYECGLGAEFGGLSIAVMDILNG